MFIYQSGNTFLAPDLKRMLRKNMNEEESGLTINIRTNWRWMPSCAHAHTNSRPGNVGKLGQQLGYQLREETLAVVQLSSCSPSPVHLHQVFD